MSDASSDYSDKCVLLYSGGLDTSVMLKWLQEEYDFKVITVTVNIGQSKDLEEVKKKAIATGSVKHYNIDGREEFVNNYVLPALMANALYEDVYPISSALSRPLIAKYGVEIALKEDAKYIAHGCTGKGNDQIRYASTIKALAPDIKIIVPAIEWGLSREEEIEYARKHGIPIPVDVDSPYSIDENLWGRSIECGVLEYEDVEPPEEVFKWTKPIEETPDRPEYVKIRFEEGIPISVNDCEYKPVEIIKYLNELGGLHGVGRIDHLEDRYTGFKSREVYEAPAAVILITAHKDLEKAVLTRHELDFKAYADRVWTNLVYSGLWIEPLRMELQAFITLLNKRVNGYVILKLYKGGLRVVGRKAYNGLYDYSLATYGSSRFDQKNAYGFIELWTLQSVEAYRKLPQEYIKVLNKARELIRIQP